MRTQTSWPEITNILMRFQENGFRLRGWGLLLEKMRAGRCKLRVLHLILHVHCPASRTPEDKEAEGSDQIDPSNMKQSPLRGLPFEACIMVSGQTLLSSAFFAMDLSQTGALWRTVQTKPVPRIHARFWSLPSVRVEAVRDSSQAKATQDRKLNSRDTACGAGIYSASKCCKPIYLRARSQDSARHPLNPHLIPKRNILPSPGEFSRFCAPLGPGGTNSHVE